MRSSSMMDLLDATIMKNMRIVGYEIKKLAANTSSLMIVPIT
jgi:hypothetical protein